MSVEIKFIRRDEIQRKNEPGHFDILLVDLINLISKYTNGMVIENTILVSFDIEFIRRYQKQCRHGEACRASPTCFWPSLINLISIGTYMIRDSTM